MADSAGIFARIAARRGWSEEERLILDSDSYCQRNLINKLRINPAP